MDESKADFTQTIDKLFNKLFEQAEAARELPIVSENTPVIKISSSLPDITSPEHLNVITLPENVDGFNLSDIDLPVLSPTLAFPETSFPGITLPEGSESPLLIDLTHIEFDFAAAFKSKNGKRANKKSRRKTRNLLSGLSELVKLVPKQPKKEFQNLDSPLRF